MKEKTAGKQQHQADNRSHREILLADHLLVDVGGEHIILPANNLGHAEIGDCQSEGNDGCGDNPVDGAGQGDGEKDPCRSRAERIGCLIKPSVGRRQRRHHDHQDMGKDVEHHADHDADGPVNGFAE